MFGTLSKGVWKQFVQEGVLDDSRLKKTISESWLRCMKKGVNPYLGEGKQVLSGESFCRLKDENALLLDVAVPYIEKIFNYIKGTHSIILLIDPQGYVLTAKGDKDIKRLARKINFVEGVKWTEEEVGTNAIGTSLVTREPVVVTGSEHYALASQPWTCSAAPIRDDEGDLLGVINISSPVQHHQPFTFATVVSGSYAIENEWKLRKHNDNRELLQKSFNLAEARIPAVICNNRKQILFASCCVQSRIGQWEGMHLRELKEYGFSERQCTPIYSDRHGGKLGFYVDLKHARQTSGTENAKKPFVSFSFPGEMGTSEAFGQTLQNVIRVAGTKANVFIYGESGTGKELIARAIHQNSDCKNGPFVAVNCGAIPCDLMESELFGYAKGAFTGARSQGYQGKFEQANHGTIFLDEIGEISPAMQVALLRVLQEKKITPIGSKREIPLNLRVITATNRDLRQMVREGAFRKDLFYRLYVFPIYVPALRERKEDIPGLVRYYCRENGWDVEIPESMMKKMVNYEWPGNIRELFNVLERICILSEGNSPDPFLIEQMIHQQLLNDSREAKKEKLLTVREEIQKQEILEALKKTGGNVSEAARMLNVPRSTFYRRLKKYGL
ncbi:sigma-54-dependent Fis family transcriptional regulator [Thermoactinomyces mirandus]|uniref:Sigma-54-dependent Fis family transcriptional regulator n=1 Tax=Thermoactinomyces mirandus TaxID=2756294 RepID=A0A7W1XRP0_9BACL|nr:sigma-54-dependent Fis family transcriptional regulator [Thermoactinomyces mirandus]MBA4602049.1 sigma-54-dependent Fis family transcriptional regulator [Thermoactinomyces mirandus]